MNIITGTTKKIIGINYPKSNRNRYCKELECNGNRRSNLLKVMLKNCFATFAMMQKRPIGKTYSYLLIPDQQISFGLLLLMMMTVACTSNTQKQEADIITKSDVKVTSPIIKTVEQSVTFKGITRYLQTNTIRSQVSGIVKMVNCQLAGTILTGQPLIVVQPMEAAALQKSNFNNEEFKSFQDTIYSNLNGTVSGLNVQVGDFVQAGDVLASCIRTNSQRIIVYVPTEQLGDIFPGMNCAIILPGGKEMEGKLIGQLPSEPGQNQTQPVIVAPLRNIKLSENINLAVRFKTGQLNDALLIPKSVLLGNEVQTEFWVMKLVNDTTCIKVPVEKGWETDSLVQLLHSNLTSIDRLVSEGGYGLPDTAIVRIIKK